MFRNLLKRGAHASVSPLSYNEAHPPQHFDDYILRRALSPNNLNRHP